MVTMMNVLTHVVTGFSSQVPSVRFILAGCHVHCTETVVM